MSRKLGKPKKKEAILNRLADNLRAFFPELDRHFMCPTCLSVISLKESSRITEAHVIPGAAGGTLRTYICNQCNSRFGANQDRWFGDYIRLSRELILKKEATLLDAPSNPGYFWIDDIRVQGAYRTEPDGGLAFYIDPQRNSPEALNTVMGRRPSTLKIEVPLLGKGQLVNVGFLTAAYLLWFKELGYSWALQAHLDQVRRQIQNPEEQVIASRFWASCPETFEERPGVGVVSIHDELVLGAFLADRFVILPPADRRDCYSVLEETFQGLRTQYQRFRFASQHRFGSPIGIIYRNRVLVSPDLFLIDSSGSRYILYPPGDELRPRLAFPVTKEEFETQRKLSNHVLVKADGKLEVPARITGKPDSDS